MATAAALLGCGCSVLAAQDDRPARVTAPTARSRAELSAAVARALNGRRVLLADDALTRDSVLVIERQAPRDAAGIPYDGRQTERPERFRLVRYGAHCVLVHERTGRRLPLRHTTCE